MGSTQVFWGSWATEPLAVIYQQPWLTEEVPIDCRLANNSDVPSEGPEGESEELKACQSGLGDLRVLQQILPDCWWFLR